MTGTNTISPIGLPRYEPRAALQGFGTSHEAFPECKAQKRLAESHSSIDPGDRGPGRDVEYTEASGFHLIVCKAQMSLYPEEMSGTATLHRIQSILWRHSCISQGVCGGGEREQGF